MQVADSPLLTLKVRRSSVPYFKPEPMLLPLPSKSSFINYGGLPEDPREGHGVMHPFTLVMPFPGSIFLYLSGLWQCLVFRESSLLGFPMLISQQAQENSCSLGTFLKPWDKLPSPSCTHTS